MSQCPYYDPDSTRELEKARRDIADVRSRNKKTAYNDMSESKNTIEKIIWQDCEKASQQSGNSLPKNVNHFFIRQEGKGKQTPPYVSSETKPYKSYGPFRKAGKGGDVPQGDKTYIDFYQGVR